jgi:hypothetical protein
MGLLDTLMADPQTLGLLSAGANMMAASGPSRMPVGLGSALTAGLQGGLAGYQGAFDNQYNRESKALQLQALQYQGAKNKMLMNMAQQYMGGAQPEAQPTAPASSPAPSLLSDPQPSGASAAGAPTSLLSTASPQAPAQAAPRSAGGMFGNMPGGLVAYGLMTDPGKLFENAASAYAPTDLQKTMRAAGIDPNSAEGKAYLLANLNKTNYIAPVNARPGAIMRDPLTNKPIAFNPHIPEGGTPLFDASGNVVGVRPLDGVTGVVSGIAAAKAGGEGSVLPYSGVDLQGNPLPVTNRTAAATQGPANAGFPAGTKTPGSGQDTNDTLSILQQERQAIAARPDGDPRKAGDLGAIDREISSWSRRLRVPIGGAVPSSAPIYAAPPMGASNAANASQGAPSKQMADAQASLSDSDNVYQQSREALTGMVNLARNQGYGGTATRFMPEGVATRLSTDAAEYQKLHANYVSLQGKALGSAGSDASRATINQSVPTYDKPQDAKIAGLTNQLNQLDLMHMKRQALSQIYQQGNEKAYAQQSATFDNIVKPSMMPTIAPILQLSGDQQRAAVQQTVKANPSLRPVFEMLFNNGVLK